MIFLLSLNHRLPKILYTKSCTTLANLWLNRKRNESSSVLQGLPSLSQMLVRFDTEEERVEQGFGLNVHLVRESCGFLQKQHTLIFPRASAPRARTSFATRTQTPCKSSGSRGVLICIVHFRNYNVPENVVITARCQQNVGFSESLQTAC